MYTQFMDMHSGGSLKEEWQYIYIEAPEAEAISVFWNRFHHDPYRVTCSCCGEDYSITEYKTLEKATDFNRNYFIKGEETITIAKYRKQEDVLIIPKREIKKSDRKEFVSDRHDYWD